LDIGVLGYIDIVQHKEHSLEVLSIPPGTPVYINSKIFTKSSPCRLDTVCCHTTAYYITTYFYRTFLTIVTLARLKYKLPDDGHRPKHVRAF